MSYNNTGELALPATQTKKATSTATQIISLPRRAISQAAQHLPQRPQQAMDVVQRAPSVLGERVVSMWQDSGILEQTQHTRALLSRMPAIVGLVSAVELFFLRRELLPDRYAFTVPAIGLLGTHDHPVYLPDIFLLLSASFWVPALTWLATAYLVPAVFGYFFNLGAAHSPSNGHASGRGRPSSARTSTVYDVDWFTFSIVKAVLTYVAYGQGVTFGVLDPVALSRINSAFYSEWKGVVTGTAVTGLLAIYEAVLRK
jgi:hypothetical protein